MGYVSWIGKYDKENSVLVDMLQKAGAVFYVKTSVPQSLMVCETVNNIIGRTVNPRNKNWSCGGSSGGEGAMVGFRGGIIGVGTDMTLDRRFNSSTFCFQLSLRTSTFSWPSPLWKNGQLDGRPRDCPLCLRSTNPFSQRWVTCRYWKSLLIHLSRYAFVCDLSSC
jgi:hypothetical protein